MLTLGALAPGKAQYYLDTVASGVEDYYTVPEKHPVSGSAVPASCSVSMVRLSATIFTPCSRRSIREPATV